MVGRNGCARDVGHHDEHSEDGSGRIYSIESKSASDSLVERVTQQSYAALVIARDAGEKNNLVFFLGDLEDPSRPAAVSEYLHQTFPERRGLDANLRHSGRFPKTAFARWPDGIQRAG